jgi:hypothetical protein
VYTAIQRFKYIYFNLFMIQFHMIYGLPLRTMKLVFLTIFLILIISCKRDAIIGPIVQQPLPVVITEKKMCVYDSMVTHCYVDTVTGGPVYFNVHYPFVDTFSVVLYSDSSKIVYKGDTFPRFTYYGMQDYGTPASRYIRVTNDSMYTRRRIGSVFCSGEAHYLYGVLR